MILTAARPGRRRRMGSNIELPAHPRMLRHAGTLRLIRELLLQSAHEAAPAARRSRGG